MTADTDSFENIPVRRFLGWEKPLVTAAAEAAAELVQGDFPADFSGIMMILPTAEAARMLREEILRHFADRGGMTGLVTGTADALTGSCREESALQSQVLAAWVKVLRRYFQSTPDGDSRLFPGVDGKTAIRDTAMLLDIAAGLQEKRMTLAREGWSLTAAAEHLASLGGELWLTQAERFQEFAALSELYREELNAASPGRPDPADNLLLALSRPETIAGSVQKIIVIDCPALNGGVRKLLAGCRAGVEIWVNAPAEYAGHFDGFGIPDPEFWSREEMPCDISSAVRAYKDPAAIAAKVTGWLNSGSWHPAAIGVLDTSVADILCREYDAGGFYPGFTGFFRPEDRPLAGLPWSRLLLLLLELRREKIPFQTAAKLLRHPYLPDHLEKYCGISECTGLLRDCDKLQSSTLAGEMAQAARHAGGELKEVFALFERWHQRLKDAADLPEELFALLNEIGSAVEESRFDHAQASAELDALKKCGAAVRSAAVDAGFSGELLNWLIRKSRISFRSTGQSAVDLIGFAELNWRPEKAVVVAGFNEESFQPDPGADALLPEALRRELGMITGDMRYAADAVRFRALCANREMRLLISRFALDHQVLKVPRLLLQCRREKLAEQVSVLLGEEIYEEVPPGENALFPGFIPRETEVPENFSVTGFKSYLESPFDFYLERVLEAQSLNDRNCELDNLQFGTLVHEVLEDYGKNGKALERAGEIKSFCLESLERTVSRDFALPLSGLVRLQLDLISDALDAFARKQEKWMAEGWSIIATERKFSVPAAEIVPGLPQSWGNKVKLVGKIDRLDMRELPDGTREFMVMDYKTFASAKKPVETHCKIAASGGETVWYDLQLPLYQYLVRHELGSEFGITSGHKLAAGYFNLPLVLSDCGIYPFDELLEYPTLGAEALAEAGKILCSVYEKKIFWPPKKPNFFRSDGFVPDAASVVSPGERSGKWRSNGGEK